MASAKAYGPGTETSASVASIAPRGRAGGAWRAAARRSRASPRCPAIARRAARRPRRARPPARSASSARIATSRSSGRAPGGGVKPISVSRSRLSAVAMAVSAAMTPGRSARRRPARMSVTESWYAPERTSTTSLGSMTSVPCLPGRRLDHVPPPRDVRAGGTERQRGPATERAGPRPGRRRRCGRWREDAARRERGGPGRRCRAGRPRPRRSPARARRSAAVSRPARWCGRTACAVTAAPSQSASHTARPPPGTAPPSRRSASSRPASASSPLGVRPGAEPDDPLGGVDRVREVAGQAGVREVLRCVVPGQPPAAR